MKATDNSTGNNIINTSIKFINISKILEIKLFLINASLLADPLLKVITWMLLQGYKIFNQF
jgi:hypothetical protein